VVSKFARWNYTSCGLDFAKKTPRRRKRCFWCHGINQEMPCVEELIPGDNVTTYPPPPSRFKTTRQNSTRKDRLVSLPRNRKALGATNARHALPAFNSRQPPRLHSPPTHVKSPPPFSHIMRNIQLPYVDLAYAPNKFQRRDTASAAYARERDDPQP
jgi:hypothetical protein